MHQFDSFREVRVMKGAGIEFRSPWMIRIGNVEIDRTNKQVECIGILAIYRRKIRLIDKSIQVC